MSAARCDERMVVFQVITRQNVIGTISYFDVSLAHDYELFVALVSAPSLLPVLNVAFG